MKSENGRVRIYAADIRPLFEEETYRKAYERIPAGRQRKADACKTQRAKAASLAAGLLAEYALSGYGKAQAEAAWADIPVLALCGEPAGQQSFRVACEPSGRPVVLPAESTVTTGGAATGLRTLLEGAPDEAAALLEGAPDGTAAFLEGAPDETAAFLNPASDGTAPSVPYISLSHSGDYAVCALSDAPVGVDVQQSVPVRVGALRHFFCEEERTAFLARHVRPEGRFLSEEAAEEFLRLWTAKESYMKLTGKGMSLGFANIRADWDAGTICCSKTDMPRAVWKEYGTLPGYYLSVCYFVEGD